MVDDTICPSCREAPSRCKCPPTSDTKDREPLVSDQHDHSKSGGPAAQDTADAVGEALKWFGDDFGWGNKPELNMNRKHGRVLAAELSRLRANWPHPCKNCNGTGYFDSDGLCGECDAGRIRMERNEARDELARLRSAGDPQKAVAGSGALDAVAELERRLAAIDGLKPGQTLRVHSTEESVAYAELARDAIAEVRRLQAEVARLRVPDAPPQCPFCDAGEPSVRHWCPKKGTEVLGT